MGPIKTIYLFLFLRTVLFLQVSEFFFSKSTTNSLAFPELYPLQRLVIHHKSTDALK